MFAHLASLLLLSFAVSLDGFGVGVTYGLRRIRIPVLSIAIIALCSGIIIWFSMTVGGWLTTYLSPAVARMIGAFILIAIGCWALLQLRRSRDSKQDEEASSVEDRKRAVAFDEVRHEPLTNRTLVSLEVKQLGIVIQILRKPQVADVDRSGSISSSEAVLLGVALSFDAFGAGLGAAMIGLHSATTAAAIALSSAVFLLAGLRVGFKYAGWRGMQSLSVLPGMLLIVMGIIKLF
ncbi:sporulation membrane protein YtaF [Paenibacillus xylaniclasticus]|uniref:sporulation membrane protein YtaF n=1 Tax=Paenibacillus xylaniclasticus TaxID=588083 RepID=UPI000FD83760|nr:MULTISPECIES: sporulation membrane protein YtaF [Paenibacillus]GFN30123.1 putative membrane protein YtaF [Paenibacillus curdlanolyticus]